MSDQRYNGYTNYETWAWALWLDNDQSRQEHWAHAAAEQLDLTDSDDDLSDRREEAARALAPMLESECEEMLDDLGAAGPLSDLLRTSIDRIDFVDIAETILADIEPPDDDDDDSAE